MACFLVDCERKSDSVLKGISHISLTENDEIVFFYSKKATRITMDLHKELENVQAKKYYMKSETEEQNSIYLLLSSYLGNCIQKNKKRKYYIVSKDYIYDSACRFWESNNIYVKRMNRISDYPQMNRQIF